VVELPAAVASTSSWADRHQLATCTERDEAQQAQAQHVAQLLTHLEATHPKIERGPLRMLVLAAASDDPAWVEQAMRAAQLGWELPERVDGDDWFAAVPIPVPDGTPLPLDAAVDPTLAAAVGAVAAEAGWAVAPPSGASALSLTAQPPEPAAWGAQRGYAQAVTATVGSHTVQVEGFAVGPLADDTATRILATAMAHLLAQSEVVQALAPTLEAPGPSPALSALERVGAAELCVFRRPDNAGVSVNLAVGPHHELAVPTAAHGCLGLPSGIEIRSPYGRRTLGEGSVLVELSDRGEPTGRFRILDGDPEAAEKLLRKTKIAAWQPKPRLAARD
jgi:hypothetical protein